MIRILCLGMAGLLVRLALRGLPVHHVGFRVGGRATDITTLSDFTNDDYRRALDGRGVNEKESAATLDGQAALPFAGTSVVSALHEPQSKEV